MKEVIVKLTSDHIKVKGGEYVQDLVRCGECKRHGMWNCPMWDGTTTEDYMWCYYGEVRDE